jgi:hypothetical protein
VTSLGPRRRHGSEPGGLPEHAALARRLGDRVGDDGGRCAPRRLMLASVFGEPALPDCMAGCHAQHQQTAFAKKKQHDAVFFVNTARFGVRGARPRRSTWQDAMRSTSRRRPAKKKSHDAMFFVNTAARPSGRLLRRMRSAAPANCVCQEQTTGCRVFRADSSSSFRRCPDLPTAYRRWRVLRGG